jgi:hypothetical protein
LYELHSILTKLYHGDQNIELLTIMNQVETIFGIIFSNSHIGSNNILLETSTTLESVNSIINSVKKKKV